MDQVAAGLGIIVIGANIFGWFFLSTGRFQSEYSSKNEKIVGVLFEEYHQKLKEIQIKEKELQIQEGKIDALYPDDKALTEKFKEVIEWKEHIQDGKRHLMRFASLAFIAAIFFGVAIIAYPSSGSDNGDTGLAITSFLVEISLISLFFSIGNLWNYCAICREIEETITEQSK